VGEMGDISIKYGESAGKIWSVLNQEGCVNKRKLLKLTQLKEDNLHSGIGWLAKENKIYKEDKDCYKLDSTNLDNEIGSCAGKVWKILDIWGDADFTTIKRLSDLSDEEVHAALGWLAKEDKISLNEKQKYKIN
jgi:hypothetical protein